MRDGIGIRILLSVVVLVGLLYLPSPVFSQQEPVIQDLIINGGFEDGFQDGFGVGYGWGAFSNGSALVGWNGDTWHKVVVTGKNAQMIQIENAAERDRYAGIYQTVPVIPGKQYKLSLSGLVRSEEGDPAISDYGYRLQYAIDYDGGTNWELLDGDSWRELQWDEQPLYLSDDESYHQDHFETTITATGDQLTLFIRGWKKWLNDGTGIFNLDEISLVGPAPEGFAEPAAQTAASAEVEQPVQAEAPAVEVEQPAQAEAPAAEVEQPAQAEAPAAAEIEPPAEAESSAQAESPPAEVIQLPVSGEGEDSSVIYIIIMSVVLLLVLFVWAALAVMHRQRSL